MKSRSRFAGMTLKKAMFTLVLLGVSVGTARTSYAGEDKPLKWDSFSTGEVKETILDNETLSDAEKVIAMTRHLDKLITLAPLTPLDILNTTDHEKKKMRPGDNYGWLIDMMVETDDWKKRFPVARPQAVAAALAALDTMPGIKNKQAVRSVLYVALALAGGDAPEDQLLHLLNRPDTPQEIVYRILGGMLGSDRPVVQDIPRLVKITRPASVPLRALPRLLELADHPWSYATGTYPGNPEPQRRIYPIRELAYACLLELGVQTKKVTVPTTGENEDGEQQVSVTQVKVDRASADKKLRALESQESPIKDEEKSPAKSK